VTPCGSRVRSTVLAVQRELADGPFVKRYIPEETDDNFSDGKGVFFILSFWLIGTLAVHRRTRRSHPFVRPADCQS
jgi:GH15 family glucan-1,4-alpha-glucosidase